MESRRGGVSGFGLLPAAAEFGPDRVGAVRGTTWHGIFEADGFRRAFLRDLAERTARRYVSAPNVLFAGVRQRRFDVLADLVEEHSTPTR